LLAVALVVVIIAVAMPTVLAVTMAPSDQRKQELSENRENLMA
jgi:hypothetical protein